VGNRQERKAGEIEPVASPLRIIGGTLRGRTIEYSGDQRTRPMKERTREAVFNLVGPSIRASHAIDLFAGAGALGLEAISRGATRATLIERHFPTARLIERSAEQLGVREKIEVIASDVFFWGRKHDPLVGQPLVVFCTPPYALYVERGPDFVSLLTKLIDEAPSESRFIVEADERFDFSCLPHSESWDVRQYAPAFVGMYVKLEE
jgi:16S rRNA (guanine966-N2)-methyltransferase